MTTDVGPLTWAQIDAAVKAGGTTVYDWCWVCGARLGPDKMHVLIDNGRVMRHTYCCRKHRYVKVGVKVPRMQRDVAGRDAGLRTVTEYQVQERTDLEIEGLSMAFKAGELKPGWE